MNRASKIISGTFLDALAGDIPSQNWGVKEWAAQFDVFSDMGMDTLVIIRGMTMQQVLPFKGFC